MVETNTIETKTVETKLTYGEMMFNRNAIAREKVKFLKNKRGVTYRFISEKSGVYDESFNRWVKGTHNFKEEKLDSIEKTFKLYNF